MATGTRIYRQGDVVLRIVGGVKAPPAGLVLVPLDEGGRVILAHGEQTGHVHEVTGGRVELLASDVEDMKRRFLRVEVEAALVHAEHATVVLPPGVYEVTRQREYTPVAVVLVAD